MAKRLERLVQRGHRLTVGLSGGVDSVLLLHILIKLSVKYDFQLSALHVNHGISTNAGHWQTFSEQLCETWGIRLYVQRVALKDSSGEGIESLARQARYAAFAEADAEWVVLAQHRDDQAETLLFNLLRGTGVAGAAAMPWARSFPGRPGLGVLRPLLDVSRGEIVSYARSEGLAWVEDESNVDIRFSRNFLRHRILPMLRDRFPGGDAALARAASHFAESEYLLNELARNDAGNAMRDGRIVASELSKLEDARARNLLRYILRCAGLVVPSSTTLREIVKQVCHAAPGKRLNFKLGGRALHRYRDEIWLVACGEPGEETKWQGEDTLTWGTAMLFFKTMTGTGISFSKLANTPVWIVPRRGGERFRPDGGRPRRTLKNLLQERAIPPWERDRMPLLWCGDDLVWAPGIGIDSAWQCLPDEPGILPIYQPDLLFP
ncbi:MAG: tRNA lysidine(34) synthetase TilS [Sulfuritalea sp.]|nr:tRNA lysidine(34) synthetase TilS [Sulfuritalea sp.]